MKLITEVNDNVTILNEAQSESGEKEYYIEGTFLQANTKNRNGRVYPEKVLDEQVQSYKEKYIDNNRALGELGHPDGPTINLDRVSHKIVDMQKDGSNWHGKAKILDTPNGKIVKNLIDEGISIGVSSRGLGSLKQNEDAYEVQSDFQLVTAADIVADPSAPDAFVEGIMEGVEWVKDDSGLFRKVDPKKLKEHTKEQIEQAVRETKHDRRRREQKFLDIFYEHLSKLC